MITIFISKKYRKDFEKIFNLVEDDAKKINHFNGNILGDVKVVLKNECKQYCHAEGNGVAIRTQENDHWHFKNYWASKIYAKITCLLEDLGYKIEQDCEDWYYR